MQDSIKTRNGRIFNIQYFCVHDGPGIRTTVFFKGCPLNCLWCHNPEGISKNLLLSFADKKCMNCAACVKACPNNAHKIIDGRHILDRTLCTLHGACVNACVTKALDIVGYDITVEEVVTKVMRDSHYYETSHGGVTISGGEPALQPEFLLSLLQGLKKENIHTAVETCGVANYSIYENILPYVDLFLFDFKETDSELHKKFTGVENKLIRENLKKLHDAGAQILLRCPIICKLNDRDDHFKGIAELAGAHKNLAGIEILPYHKLAASKIGRMGLPVQEEYEPVPGETSDKWRQILRGYGVKVIEA